MFRLITILLLIVITPKLFANEVALPKKMAKVSFESKEDIPEELLEYLPGAVFEKSFDGKVDFILGFPNDNFGFGIFQLVSDKRTGDDFDFTHGQYAKVGTANNDYYIEGSYTSNLYTQQLTLFYDNGDRENVDQFFTEENILKILFSTEASGKPVFYEVGVGYLELNRDDVRGWVYATGTQETFHKYTADYDPVNIPRDGESDSGFFADFGVGLANRVLYQNGSVRVAAKAKVNAFVTEVEDGNSVTATAAANIFQQSRKDSFTYMGGVRVETTAHETEDNYSVSLGAVAGVGKGPVAVTIDASKVVAGSAKNHVDFNLNDEAIYTLEVKYSPEWSKRKSARKQSVAQAPTREPGTNFKQQSQAYMAKRAYKNQYTQRQSIVFGTFGDPNNN